jgi:hypothetical protein
VRGQERSLSRLAGHAGGKNETSAHHNDRVHTSDQLSLPLRFVDLTPGFSRGGGRSERSRRWVQADVRPLAVMRIPW